MYVKKFMILFIVAKLLRPLHPPVHYSNGKHPKCRDFLQMPRWKITTNYWLIGLIIALICQEKHLSHTWTSLRILPLLVVERRIFLSGTFSFDSSISYSNFMLCRLMKKKKLFLPLIETFVQSENDLQTSLRHRLNVAFIVWKISSDDK